MDTDTRLVHHLADTDGTNGLRDSKSRWPNNLIFIFHFDFYPDAWDASYSYLTSLFVVSDGVPLFLWGCVFGAPVDPFDFVYIR